MADKRKALYSMLNFMVTMVPKRDRALQPRWIKVVRRWYWMRDKGKEDGALR